MHQSRHVSLIDLDPERVLRGGALIQCTEGKTQDSSTYQNKRTNTLSRNQPPLFDLTEGPSARNLRFRARDLLGTSPFWRWRGDNDWSCSLEAPGVERAERGRALELNDPLSRNWGHLAVLPVALRHVDEGLLQS